MQMNLTSLCSEDQRPPVTLRRYRSETNLHVNADVKTEHLMQFKKPSLELGNRSGREEKQLNYKIKIAMISTL